MKSKKTPKGKRGKKALSASTAKSRPVGNPPGPVRPAIIPPGGPTLETVGAATISVSSATAPSAPLAQPAPVSLSSPKPAPVEHPRKLNRVRKPVILPPLLLEGDDPIVPEPLVAGPGERFVLGPVVPEVRPPPALDLPGEALPKAYGTERLFLTPRDPHCLHAAWDLTPEQQRHYSALAQDRQLIVRMYVDHFSNAPTSETGVEAATRSCFLPVTKGGTSYVAELGYHDRLDRWQVIAQSGPVVTPREAPSAETKLEFATIPAQVSLKALVEEVQQAKVAELPPVAAPALSLPDVPAIGMAQPTPPAFREIESPQPAPTPAPIEAIEVAAVAELAPTVPPIPAAHPAVPVPTTVEVRSEPAPTPEGKANIPVPVTEVVKQALSDHVPLLEAVRQLRTQGWTGLPELPSPIALERPSAAMRFDELTQLTLLQSGSLEIMEVLQRHLEKEIMQPAPTGGEEALPIGALAAPSSPAGQEQTPPGERPFWFNVNAELIIYGATEKDARLAVGGREVRLRPDGTFSCRFALPDGQYPLLIRATAADGSASRSAQLQFSRDTQVGGEVGTHPQDPALKAPLEANFT